MKRKHIIVAIDFSQGSIHAFRYAIMIANKIDADITMMWVDKVDTADIFLPKERKSGQKEIIKAKFDELVERYKHGNLGGGKKFRGELMLGKLDYKIKKGKVYKEIIHQAIVDETYLIIAGTHGASGFEEFWIGSNAKKIVSQSPCPTITARYGACLHEGIKKIVLPISLSIDTRQKVPFAIELAKKFGAEIHLLPLTPDEKSLIVKVQKYTDQVLPYIEKENIPYKIHLIKGDNHVGDTLKYAEKENASMFIVMAGKESENNFFSGTYPEQLLRLSPIPVMHIHPKEIYETYIK